MAVIKRLRYKRFCADAEAHRSGLVHGIVHGDRADAFKLAANFFDRRSRRLTEGSM